MKHQPKWQKSKTKRWYKAICAAAKKRRGEKRTLSLTRSATLRKTLSDPEWRKQQSKRLKQIWKRDRKERVQALRKAAIQTGKTIKKLWADPKYRAKMLKVRKKQCTSKERKRLRQMLLDNWANPKFRAKMCIVRKTQSKGNQVRHPKGSWYRCKYVCSCGCGWNFWMRSSWEVAFAHWLDHFGIAWEYESKKFCIGKGKYYTPDFYLPDQNEYVELKGWLTDKNKEKIKLFRSMYPDIKLYVFFGEHLGKILQFRKAA